MDLKPRWLEKYNPASPGERVLELGTEAQGGHPGALDFDAAGYLYVVNGTNTWRYAAPGYGEASVFSAPGEIARAITVDRASGEVYELENEGEGHPPL